MYHYKENKHMFFHTGGLNLL